MTASGACECVVKHTHLSPFSFEIIWWVFCPDYICVIRLLGGLEGISQVFALRWQVQLEPVPLHLEPPTAQEFHTDLQQLFSTGEGRSPAEG